MGLASVLMSFIVSDCIWFSSIVTTSTVRLFAGLEWDWKLTVSIFPWATDVYDTFKSSEISLSNVFLSVVYSTLDTIDVSSCETATFDFFFFDDCGYLKMKND